jgi:NTE family protein
MERRLGFVELLKRGDDLSERGATERSAGRGSSRSPLPSRAGQRVTSVSFLRNVPVLAGLSDELLRRLIEEVQEVRVGAGEWVMRQGDTAESVCIVRSGRLEVLDEGPPEAVIRILRRGDVLGELALLREGTRSASVRARRDTELIELGRASFERLIQTAPSFALGLTRAMGAQLAASRTPVAAATPPRTIAVVGLDQGAPVAEVCELLADSLAGHGSVARLGAGELASIEQAEREADRVVLRCAAAPGDPWTDLCVSEAHLVVALSSGVLSAEWRQRATALQGCELLVFAAGVAETVVQALQPREVQVMLGGFARGEQIAALARRIAGRSLGLVLSGGGARALAHIGVIQELREAGVRFDRVGGVSLGSLAAAGAAADFTTEHMYESFARAFQRSPSRDFVLPAYSLVRGSRARRLLHDNFGDRRIEELPLRFFCLSCDLVGRQAVLHRVGPVVDAVYPSLAIPGIFPPVVTDEGQLLVDGGVLDNLPVATMARTGEGPIIAVDVTGRIGQSKRARPTFARLARPMRRALTGNDAEIPHVGETILRTLTVGSIDTVAAARLHADLVITPQVEDIGLMEWKALPRAVELGRRAAREALAAHSDLLGRLTSGRRG